MMNERFAKLLLGEDMFGGGKGVCTALAISNAISDLSGSVFGELRKLEPLSPEKKSMWHQEMDLILCVGDFIVEFVPSTQDVPGGGTFEVMVTRPRSDLIVNLPALKKLDAQLQSILDEFCDSEFFYVDHDELRVDGNEMFPLSSLTLFTGYREEWWLPSPKVPRNGLSDDTRNRLIHFKECANKVLKAAMVININVLKDMEIPDDYLESLPKSGKACLGENVYYHITSHKFSPDGLLDHLDLSSAHTILEIADRIEAAAHVWRKKHRKVQRVQEKSTWSRVKVSDNDLAKGKVLARRADTLLQNLKLRLPALLQTTLDMDKIQHNKDIGYAILEGYSRAIESLAFNLIARIDDVLLADDAARQTAATELTSKYDQERLGDAPPKGKLRSSSSFTLRRCLSDVHSSHGKIKSLNGRSCSFAKKNKLRNLPNQTLQKLNF